MIKNVLSLVVAVLPFSFLRVFGLRWLLGYKIGRGVRVGFSIINVSHCEIDDGVVIGNLNQITGFERLVLRSGSRIGNLNRFTGSKLKGGLFAHSPNRLPELFLGEQAMLTSRHFIDVQDAVSIGCFTTIAGAEVRIWSHQIDVLSNMQTTRPVSVGRYCYICSQVSLLPGAVVPDLCVVAACAVVVRPFSETNALYAGNPAVIKKTGISGAYFHRTLGFVD
jgi:acetyltransferase-like isoleucine patch superfamily enzyme